MLSSNEDEESKELIISEISRPRDIRGSSQKTSYYGFSNAKAAIISSESEMGECRARKSSNPYAK